MALVSSSENVLGKAGAPQISIFPAALCPGVSDLRSLNYGAWATGRGDNSLL